MLTMSMFVNSRQYRRAVKRQAVIDHNTAHELKLARRMPLVIPQPEAQPELITAPKKPTLYGMAPTDMVTTLALAVVYKHRNDAARYRGFIQRGSSPRAYARAAGYSNAREMQAYARLKELEAKQREQQAAVA